MAERGVLYVATGEDFVREAETSAAVLNEKTDLPIALVSDTPSHSELFDHQSRLKEPAYGFADKIRGLAQTPFERTLFVDTDTYVSEDPSNLFQLLNSFHLGAAHNTPQSTYDLDGVPESFPEFNTGVLIYRSCPAVEAFLDEWLARYHDAVDRQPHDQPSFRRLLYEEGELRFATLPPEYNCLFRYPGQVEGSVKIFHGRLMPVDGPGADQYFDIEEAVAVINRTPEIRTFTQLGGISVHSNEEDSLVSRIRMSAQRHGYRHLLREGLRRMKRAIGK